MRIKFTLAVILISLSLTSKSQTTIRANALGWAGAVANIGFETALSKHMTFVAEGYYSPFWNLDDFRMRGYNLTPELRYYFCEKFNKHYVGVHGNYADYSRLQLGGGKHIREGIAYGAGVTYGHTWIFNHSWSFDLFAGVGWWHMKNDIYSRCEPDFLIQKDVVENKIGLSRLGASFAYRF